MPTRTADTPTRRLRVLTTYRALIPSVRWFGLEQLRWLEGQGLLELRAVPEHRLSALDCRWADCVVLTRADTPFECWLAHWLRRRGRTLLYVLDDDLEHVPEGLGCSTYYRDPAVLRQSREVRGCCNVLVTHSPLLEQAYGTGFRRVVRIEQPAMLERARAESVPDRPSNVVRIGFSGSADRAADVQKVLAEPLRALKQRYGERVELVFFGAHPPLVEELHCTYLPYTSSAEEYYRIMAAQAWDIGLAPLVDDRFYRSKYYNKFVEYCTYGVTGVYSDLPPYRCVVRDGTDGVLCGVDEWLPTLCALVEEPERRTAIAQAARLRAGDFALDKVSARFWQALGMEITDRRAPDGRFSSLALQTAKVIYVALLMGQTLKRHGWSTFSIAAKRLKERRRRRCT